MYEERRERFSFKSFFLTLLLVLLFVFLMLWLFPNKWDLKNMHVYENQSSYDIDRLSVLYNEIFANNVERMKDAAVGYFTNERMPKNVGDSKKLTLKEMYDLHLVLKMKDKNGKECDQDKSYVKMTKYDDEYRLKVNLSCGSDEDYIIVYLGCYSYCPDGVCEKRASTTNNSGKVTPQPEPSKVVYSCKVVNGKYYNKSGNVVSKEDYEKSCTTPEKHVCEELNGKYYDKNGKSVSESEYKKSCGISEKYSCKVVDGKYYDKNGKVVSKEDYNKSCIEPEEKHTCEVVNGKYYDKDGKVVSKDEYTKSCTVPEEKHTCEVVNGKYYDKDGNVVSESKYKESCEPVKYMYEYKLETQDSTTCSAWSAWQKEKVKKSSTRQVETKTEKEIISYKTVSIQTGEKKEIKEVQEKYITGYTTKLVYVGTKDVKVGTTTKEVEEKVAVGTVKVFAGVGTGTKVPKDTSTKTYIVISQDDVKSCSNCEKEVKYTWEIYNIETVYDVVTKTVTVDVYKTIDVYEEQEVPVYDYRTVKKEVVTPIYTEYQVPEYGDVKYYRYKDCTTVKGTVDIKWSYNKEDKDLINKGYKFTGNVKQV